MQAYTAEQRAKLIALAENIINYSNEQPGLQELARIALASLKAGPLGYIRYEDAALLPFERKHTCVEIAVYKQQSFSTDSPVYTAPPVVALKLPDEVKRADAPCHLDVYEADCWVGGAMWMREQVQRLNAAAPAVPDGWQLVPVEPTREMCDAFDKSSAWENVDFWEGSFDLVSGWEAMLSVAPSPPETL